MYDEERFIQAEATAIAKAKWIRGETIHADPGNAFCEDWISKFAIDFRRRWTFTMCKDCKKECAWQCKAFCENYDEDKKSCL